MSSLLAGYLIIGLIIALFSMGIKDSARGILKGRSVLWLITWFTLFVIFWLPLFVGAFIVVYRNKKKESEE